MNRNLMVGMLVASLVVAGCTIQSKHEDGDHKKNVKIETPLGGLNVPRDCRASSPTPDTCSRSS